MLKLRWKIGAMAVFTLMVWFYSLWAGFVNTFFEKLTLGKASALAPVPPALP